MSFDEYQPRQEQERDARRERIRIEIYRAAAQIYTVTRVGIMGAMMDTIPSNRDGMFEAVRELWEAVEDQTSRKTEDFW
jgi:hypothetical protein